MIESTLASRPFFNLRATVEDTAEQQEQQQQNMNSDNDGDSFLTTEESSAIIDLYKKATADTNEDDTEQNSEENFAEIIQEELPKLSPNLIMKLKQGWEDDNETELKQQFQKIATVLHDLSVQRLEIAKTTLQDLMNAGEIKKLDSLIGKAARNGDLDVAFFQVLQINIQDAAATTTDTQPIPKVTSDDEEAREEEDGNEEVAASRLQILQHIYTRCQEEVEKIIAPGVALLNKLLRTEQPSIRRNQLEHYLTPQVTKIKSPDGKEIDISPPTDGNTKKKTLVEHSDFIDALGRAVQQIRSVENAGATTPEIAAGMVESCRQVAIEARIVIGESYGQNSTQLIEFEDALQPVFRPTSTDSPYITGAASDASDGSDDSEDTATTDE